MCASKENSLLWIFFRHSRHSIRSKAVTNRKIFLREDLFSIKSAHYIRSYNLIRSTMDKALAGQVEFRRLYNYPELQNNAFSCLDVLLYHENQNKFSFQGKRMGLYFRNRYFQGQSLVLDEFAAMVLRLDGNSEHVAYVRIKDVKFQICDCSLCFAHLKLQIFLLTSAPIG